MDSFHQKRMIHQMKGYQDLTWCPCSSKRVQSARIQRDVTYPMPPYMELRHTFTQRKLHARDMIEERHPDKGQTAGQTCQDSLSSSDSYCTIYDANKKNCIILNNDQDQLLMSTCNGTEPAKFIKIIKPTRDCKIQVALKIQGTNRFLSAGTTGLVVKEMTNLDNEENFFYQKPAGSVMQFESVACRGSYIGSQENGMVMLVDKDQCQKCTTEFILCCGEQSSHKQDQWTEQQRNQKK
ncbi:uncharacterized protein LOC115468078 [Microcaecilia unicolor]|uniref:Interleukin-1 beta n=1 Tax=Microcaecilia unicolor TaxID=1415580 RepID=A0A6P7XXL9_9AMPH|nr:uncharacterized protein LOC115468078 [Microcaecilia unicolor]